MVDGWKAATRGMRNAFQSWDKGDSRGDGEAFVLGTNDADLCRRLIKAGSADRKFLRYINVSFDITAPTYWFAELDTYKIGTTRNSTSFMHRGTAKPFERSDFAVDEGANKMAYKVLDYIICELNDAREAYLETKDYRIFRAMRQLLPMSYKYKSTMTMNYEVLMNIYSQRKHHRLSEWHEFCEWIESLPYMSEFLVAAELKEDV